MKTLRWTKPALIAGALTLAACGGDRDREPESEAQLEASTGAERAGTASPTPHERSSMHERASEPEPAAQASDGEGPVGASASASTDLQQRYEGEEGTVYNVGIVSYYDDSFAGQTTASGDVYDPQEMTAATDTDLPMGTIIRVERVGTDRSVVVRVNDRMQVGNEDDKILDLSRAAAAQLGILERGVTEARIVVLERPGRGATASAGG